MSEYGGFIPNKEYWDNINKIDREFILRDANVASRIAKEYLHYIFETQGVPELMVIKNFRIKLTVEEQ